MKLLFENWNNFLKEEETSDIASKINSIPMYRGSRAGDPSALEPGLGYFISSLMYAKTYGPTVEFRLNIQNPKVVDQNTWVSTYDTIMLRLNPDPIYELREEGYDSVVTKLGAGEGIYVVMVLDTSESVV